MCLINFHFQDHPKYKLVVVANRDESYARPTASADFWEDNQNILAGRDLLQGGTWLGVTKTGRFAALTNYRDPSLPTSGRVSRGAIVRQYLSADVEPLEFIRKLAEDRSLYDGFNIIVGGGDQLVHYNNILDETNVITPGTHSLSNHTLNTPWPKVVKGRQQLKDYMQANQNTLEFRSLFEIISDRTIAEDKDLPHTGVGLELERALSSLFIKTPNYGTRSSTVLLIDKKDEITFIERAFIEGELYEEKRFTFKSRIED